MKRWMPGFLAALFALATTGLLAKDKPEGGGGGKGFAGMIGGTVAAKDGARLTVEVTAIEKVWKHSNLEQPGKLVGQRIRIEPSSKASNVAKYAATLKAGDSDHFDVKQDGEVFRWLELTKEQRAKIGGDAR